jgi:hypothetical protein
MYSDSEGKGKSHKEKKNNENETIQQKKDNGHSEDEKSEVSSVESPKRTRKKELVIDVEKLGELVGKRKKRNKGRRPRRLDLPIGIYVHSCRCIKLEYVLKRPKVQISFVDGNTGRILAKEDEEKDQVYSTRRCSVISAQNMIAKWEELIISEKGVDKEDLMIFFELVNDEEKLLWAFLKLSKTINFLSQRLKLQLYKYQKNLSEKKMYSDIYRQWVSKSRKMKKSAYIEVTIKEIKVISKPETGENGDELPEMNDKVNSNIKSTFNIPNLLLSRRNLSERGSNLVKFSTDGRLLACVDAAKERSDIYIFNIPDFRIVYTLKAHTNLIHDLDWVKGTDTYPKYLVSSSSDCSSILWKLMDTTYSYTILFQPTFVYAGKFLKLNEKEIVTGGRDGILRIWRNTTLIQEIDQHKGFIKAIVVFKLCASIYSLDSQNVFIEWALHKDKYVQLREIKYPELSRSVGQLLLNSKGTKMFIVEDMMPRVYELDLSTGVLAAVKDEHIFVRG